MLFSIIREPADGAKPNGRNPEERHDPHKSTERTKGQRQGNLAPVNQCHTQAERLAGSTGWGVLLQQSEDAGLRGT